MIVLDSNYEQAQLYKMLTNSIASLLPLGTFLGAVNQYFYTGLNFPPGNLRQLPAAALICHNRKRTSSSSFHVLSLLRFFPAYCKNLLSFLIQFLSPFKCSIHLPKDTEEFFPLAAPYLRNMHSFKTCWVQEFFEYYCKSLIRLGRLMVHSGILFELLLIISSKKKLSIFMLYVIVCLTTSFQGRSQKELWLTFKNILKIVVSMDLIHLSHKGVKGKKSWV